LVHSDFKIGTEFRYRGNSWRCTDVGSRVVVAICLTEVWVVKTAANTGQKERVRITNLQGFRFDGPPYQVREEVICEENMTECVLFSDWEKAKKILALAGSG